MLNIIYNNLINNQLVLLNIAYIWCLNVCTYIYLLFSCCMLHISFIPDVIPDVVLNLPWLRSRRSPHFTLISPLTLTLSQQQQPILPTVAANLWWSRGTCVDVVLGAVSVSSGCRGPCGQRTATCLLVRNGLSLSRLRFSSGHQQSWTELN